MCSLIAGEDENEGNVMVLSYPQYCRYRSILKRIQEKPSSVLADQFVQALGGIPIINKNTKILYCRDTFDHPTLIDNESICDEFGKSPYNKLHRVYYICRGRSVLWFLLVVSNNNESDGNV